MRVFAAAAATILLASTGFAADQPSLRFDNGLWFNGERFVPSTVFVEYERLRFAKDKKDARAPADVDGALCWRVVLRSAYGKARGWI